MGDAAHATTPWQGAGGGMSIEDSLVISSLLGCAKTPAEAQIALKIYDQVRRPRTQHLVESARAVGLITSGLGEGKLDPGKIKADCFHRWDFILNYDNEKHRDEAVEMMKRELKS
jgi:salicylate hydroxylase